MPFFKSKINFPLEEMQEKNLKIELGKAVLKNFGYGEEYLLAIFEDSCKIYLRGEKIEKIAYIEVEIFGNENHIGYKNFAEDVTKIFNYILKIPTQNIYIKFEDIKAFSVCGKIFDRND